MSGDSQVRRRKGAATSATSEKKKAKAPVASKQDKVRPKTGSDAGWLTKLAFFLALGVASTLVTLHYVDYKEGQLKQAYLDYVPEEVRKRGSVDDIFFCSSHT